ncbi:alpha-1,2-fucosyltransferase [Pedobacter endophyticus]|uniref:Alpha-1,2-fucosyltransferase n=1 Tax=Pedobacter endophyticus TaxID=2789740 RepID=A0A7U3Q578_9SPHI|nr:alpha-1,2-fucosyltransferase [Pedobacter endophyticus]QPH38835.1 alpha-1,2-fucosyltransferase [Pedobacter endophyticus]
MKIVKILGGLGNQMFQYAFYLALRKNFGTVKISTASFDEYTLHNGFELEHIFNIQADYASGVMSKIYDPTFNKWNIRKLRRVFGLKKTYYEEKKLFDFDKQALEENVSNRLYWGYWQNERYFIDIADEITNAFKFRPPLSAKNKLVNEEIKHSNSVAIHVRRGDYLTNELLGGLCGLDYYQQAISILEQRIPNAIYFIFSNDIDWCKAHLNLPKASAINWNHGLQSYVDMQLMSACKHQIIANSSFSWWAAWLNSYSEKIVIAPKIWANGIDNNDQVCPKTWLRI